MTIISGPELLSGRFPGSETDARVDGDRHCLRSTAALLLVGSFVLACGAHPRSTYPSVQLAPDRQSILVIRSDRAMPSQLPLEHLPAESTLAPGLYYHPQRFELVRVSPDGRYAAFSTAGHHSLIGLLDLATMAVQEMDVVTEGDVIAFHWTADGRALAYDYIPAGGYRRVKGYDVESRQGLVMPRKDGDSAIHVTFESWGPRPHEVILQVTDGHGNERRIETVTLTPHH